MASLTVTVAEVLPTGSGAQFLRDYLCGETITAGMVVYLNASSVWMKAQSDGTAIEAGSSNYGFAMHASLAGQPLCVQAAGIFVVGATAAPTVGEIYYIGTTYGAINPYSDLVSTNKITILGIGYTSSSIDMSVKRYTGIAVP